MNLVRILTVGWFTAMVTVPLAACIAFGCRSRGPEASTGSGGSSDSWTYPVRLGDSRSKTHEVLSTAARTTDVLEEYPMSGVTVWYDPEGRVAKLNFHGEAGALYSGPVSMFGQNWIPSNRPLVFGLNAHSNEGEFARVLGPPVDRNEAGGSGRREVRSVWRKAGYLIDATFLASDRSKDQKLFRKGTLLWFEVSRGL